LNASYSSGEDTSGEDTASDGEEAIEQILQVAEPMVAPEGCVLATVEEEEPRSRPFVPYATALIWPNVEVFVLVMFAPVLAGKAASALAHAYVTGCCTLMSCWLPIVVLVVITYFLLRSARIIRRFSGEAAKRAFAHSTEPASFAVTPDPIFRLINRLRQKLGLELIDRFAGDYTIQPPHLAEPQRTGRIIRRLFAQGGHDYGREPLHGADALYFIWIGDGRGHQPWYVYSTLVINVALQITLQISSLEALFPAFWFWQGVIVMALLASAIVWTICVRPMCDRLLIVQEVLMYTCNLIAAFCAFAAYHIDAFEEKGALVRSQFFTDLSLWILVLFMLYDAFMVSIINRIHVEGSGYEPTCASLASIPLNIVRAVCNIASVLLVKDLKALPDDPYASKGTHGIGGAPGFKKLLEAEQNKYKPKDDDDSTSEDPSWDKLQRQNATNLPFLSVEEFDVTEDARNRSGKWQYLKSWASALLGGSWHGNNGKERVVKKSGISLDKSPFRKKPLQPRLGRVTLRRISPLPAREFTDVTI